ncbi:MAG: family 20 glycosylhydrolase, partial [Muribaculaceae bacterium]|nr:family 20 glycosylhydrolase [Muribaculaceae bacterium]
YKINVLHLHFIDDEGWRIEIPGLEELTEIGSRRGHTTDESDCLFPQYDGNLDPQASTSGNGYYTREEFIDLLRYADARHIRVIPEVEMPGHARSAIKAMNTRHTRYRDTDPIKASEYLLADFDDQSQYRSAQWYSDNAMNPALPSTYRFIDKVIGEIAAMYREAGAPLQSIHLGGDEVAHGAWTASPLVKEFMDKNGMTEIRQVAEHFITEASAILEKHGLKFGAWQEAAIGHSPEGDKLLAPRAEGIYCWNTVPEWDGDRIPYSIANNGYPVILCNVNNFYLDLAYDPHPAEPGLNWAGYLDESKSLSMLPYDVYRSARTDIAGNPVVLDNADKGKPALTPQGRANIRGVQAQLWSETVRNFDMVQYYTFPKILGLAERGWNVHPVWETMRGAEGDKAFDRDLAFYYAKIGSREMPRWNRSGINFRLPYPGLKIENGKLLANSPIPGAEIRYTTDGTEPNAGSTLWTAPVDCDGKRVKAKLFHLGKESVTAEMEP